MKLVRLDVLIEPETKDALTKYSQESHIPMSKIVRLALTDYINKKMPTVADADLNDLDFGE